MDVYSNISKQLHYKIIFHILCIIIYKTYFPVHLPIILEYLFAKLLLHFQVSSSLLNKVTSSFMFLLTISLLKYQI